MSREVAILVRKSMLSVMSFWLIWRRREYLHEK
jgi:hypothetical protein